MDMCKKYRSWSAAGHIRQSMIWQDPIRAGLHDAGLDLFRNG